MTGKSLEDSKGVPSLHVAWVHTNKLNANNHGLSLGTGFKYAFSGRFCHIRKFFCWIQSWQSSEITMSKLNMIKARMRRISLYARLKKKLSHNTGLEQEVELKLTFSPGNFLDPHGMAEKRHDDHSRTVGCP